MSNYTKTVNFATKDNLISGNPLKIVKGTEIDTEYNNIATAVATKTDNAAAVIVGGTIDNTAIGGTTPAAGAFTTLAASGTTTLAGALVGAVTQAAFNTVSTTLNLGGAATAVNIGAATGTATVANTTLAAKAITASTTLAVTGTSTLTGAVTATAGVTGPITSSSVAITGGSITGITDLAVADGGTGASTAAGALNNLLPAQASAANKYLQSDGTNASWDAVSLSTADITGTLGVANGGTGVTTSTGTTNVVLSNSPTLVTPILGTPTSATLTNATGLPISTGVSGLGTGVATLLATPSSANLASAITDETGSGSLVFATSPTLVTPILGTPTSGTLTNATGLPISTGVSGLGTGVATFLATPSSANLRSALTDETGTGSAVFATSPTLVTPLLGTPTSGVATNLTGLPLTTGVTGQLPVANGGTGTATPSIVAGSNVTVTGTWPNQTIAASASGGTPGGSTTQVQYNNAGAFGGITGATTNGTALTLVAPVLGTPASGVATNLTGLPLSTGVTGTLPVANGGTGQTSYTDGQLLIGNTTGNTLTKTTLTAGSGITITNGNGSISIASSGASAATPTVLGTVYGNQTSGGGTPYLTAYGYNAGLATTGVGCTAVGVGALTTNSSGANHTAIGYRALLNSTVNDNSTAVGFESMLTTTTGNECTALGFRSLYSQNSGYFNTAIGVQAAYNLTTADSVTAVGHKALFTNTTGVQNVALGFNALYGNTTASNGTAVGYQAGYTNTTAGSCTYVGQQAGRLNSTGNYMTAIGDTALNSATGASNTAVGFQAGYGVTSGANSVYIGSECGGAIGSGQYNVIIGAIAATTATGSSNTYVGRAVANSSTSGDSNSGYGMNCLVNLSTGGNNVAVGASAGTQAGVVDITSQSNYITIGNNASTNAYIKIAWTVTSDSRDKTEVQPVPHGLSFVNQLNPVSFKFKKSREDATPTGDVRYGFLAQDVLALEGSDSVVIDAKDSENLKYTDQNMTAILVKAIQELKAEFDAYKLTHP